MDKNQYPKILSKDRIHNFQKDTAFNAIQYLGINLIRHV